MSMSSIGAGFGAAQSQLVQVFEKRRQDFQAMASAVQSGDMPGAQQALTALQQDQTTIQAARPSGTWRSNTGTQGGANNPLATDLTTLIQDVQSGDLPGAQQALTQLQQDRAQTAAGNATPAGASSATGASQIQQDADALIKAIQDGDADSAKQDLAKLQDDIKAQGAGGHRHRHYHHRVEATADSATASTNASSTSHDAATNQTASPDANSIDRSRLFAVLAAYLGQNTPQTSLGVVA